MKKYLINTGIVLFFVGVLLLAPKVVPNTLPKDLVPSFQYFLPIVMVFIVAKLLNRTGFLKAKGKDSPFPLFSMIIIIACIQFVPAFLSIEKRIYPNLRAIILMLLFTFLLSIFEEFLFRGILLDRDLRHLNDDREITNKIYFASLLFALIHFYNLYL